MRNDFESNYLAHHGILGQKWGHKNGPPYPLDAGDHSSSEKKAGYKKSIGGGRNEELYDRPSKLKQFKNRLNTKEYKKAQTEYGIQKHAYADSELQSMKMHRNARLAKENPYISKYSSKTYAEWAKNYDKTMAESQKKVKELVDKYGEKALDKTLLPYQKQRLNWIKAERQRFIKEETDEKWITEGKKNREREDMAKAVLSNQKSIASSMAKEMVSDMKRWDKEEGYTPHKSLQNKSDSQREKILTKYVSDMIGEMDKDGLTKFNDGTINFNISGIPMYADSQPLTIDYDPKTKKVKNFYYL